METYLLLILTVLLGIGVFVLVLLRQLYEVNHNLFQIAYMLDHWNATRQREMRELAEAEDDDFDDEEPEGGA